MLVGLVITMGCVSEQQQVPIDEACEASTEVCDGIDNDCNGLVDDQASDGAFYYPDVDGDGWGQGTGTWLCALEDGFADRAGDCDDGDAAISPDAVEVCDAMAIDDDCDGLVNEDDPDLDPAELLSWYADADADGWGSGDEQVGCEMPAAAAAVAQDCDDGDASIHPGAKDICDDGVDSDCDGEDLACPVEGEVPLDSGMVEVFAERIDDVAGSVLVARDFNGDGFDDLVVGAALQGIPDESDQGGAAYIVHGPITADLSLSDADAIVRGEASNLLGNGVHAGDVDGDGTLDLLTAAGGDPASHWIFQGPISGDLSSADADHVVTLDISLGGYPKVHDVDGDGIDDLLLGDVGADAGYGAAYLFRGPFGAELTTDDADVTWNGPAFGSGTGMGFDVVGDTDGDGIDELAIAAPWFYDKSTEEMTYLHSMDALSGGDVEAGTARLIGPHTVANCGMFSRGSDLDGDGYDDIITTCPYGNGGQGFVVVAHGPVSGDVQLSTLPDRLEGPPATTQLGWDVLPTELDGDGIADLVIGAPAHYPIADEGAVYAVLGPISGTHTVTDVADTTWLGQREGGSVGIAIDTFDDGFVFGASNGSDRVKEAVAAYVVPSPY